MELWTVISNDMIKYQLLIRGSIKLVIIKMTYTWMESYRIVVQAANQNTKFKFMKTIAFSLSMVSEATVRKNFIQTFP